MMKQNISFGGAAACCFALVLWSSVLTLPVSADMLPYGTIEELADQADLIVRGAELPNDKFRIVKTFKGTVTNQTISVKDLSKFQTKVHGHSQDSPQDVGRKNLVLFLNFLSDGVYQPCRSGAGVKRIHKEKVFAYTQEIFEYILLQSHESATDTSVRNHNGNKEPLSPQLLEAYILTSLRCSRTFTNTLRLTNETQRVRALSRYLTTHFGHSDYYARKALEALSSIGKPAIPSVLNILKAEVCNPNRHRIVRQLGSFKDPEVIPFLIHEMEMSTRQCRRAAVHSLGLLKATEAVEPMCKLLSDCNDKDFPQTIIEALGRVRDRRATESVAQYLNSRDPRIRTEAARTLALLQDSEAFKPLVTALGNPLRNGDIVFRCAVMDALYRSDKALSVPIFIEHLRSPQAEVAHEARTCLSWIWKPLWEMKDYQSAKNWYEQLPKDANGIPVLPKGN